MEKKKIEKETSDMQREMQRLQNRLSGVTIRKPKEG
jgi:DNA-binding protein YbaB